MYGIHIYGIYAIFKCKFCMIVFAKQLPASGTRGQDGEVVTLFVAEEI